MCLEYRLSLFLRFCRLEFDTATAVRHAYGLFCTLFIEYDFYVFKKKQYLADVTKKKIGQLEDDSSLYTMNRIKTSLHVSAIVIICVREQI